jgi:predicted transcriptional regulator
MTQARAQSISDAEREVLKALWDHGSGTVREINQVLNAMGRRWAHTTVLTLLHRLEAKRYVASDKSGFAHVFRAAISRDELVSQRLADLADDFCDGTAAPLVRALVQGHRFSNAEIDQFRQLIERLSGNQSDRKLRAKRKEH